MAILSTIDGWMWPLNPSTLDSSLLSSSVAMNLQKSLRPIFWNVGRVSSDLTLFCLSFGATMYSLTFRAGTTERRSDILRRPE